VPKLRKQLEKNSMNSYAKPISNILLNDFKGAMKKRKLTIENCGVEPELLGFLVKGMVDKTFDRKWMLKFLNSELDRTVQRIEDGEPAFEKPMTMDELKNLLTNLETIVK